MQTAKMDFEELWMHPTPDGWRYSRPGNEEVIPIDMRVTIEADTRDAWRIVDVAAVYSKPSPARENRLEEDTQLLEGDELERAKDFLYDMKTTELQDKVNFLILPDYEHDLTISDVI